MQDTSRTDAFRSYPTRRPTNLVQCPYTFHGPRNPRYGKGHGPVRGRKQSQTFAGDAQHLARRVVDFLMNRRMRTLRRSPSLHLLLMLYHSAEDQDAAEKFGARNAASDDCTEQPSPGYRSIFPSPLNSISDRVPPPVSLCEWS